MRRKLSPPTMRGKVGALINVCGNGPVCLHKERRRQVSEREAKATNGVYGLQRWRFGLQRGALQSSQEFPSEGFRKVMGRHTARTTMRPGKFASPGRYRISFRLQRIVGEAISDQQTCCGRPECEFRGRRGSAARDKRISAVALSFGAVPACARIQTARPRRDCPGRGSTDFSLSMTCPSDDRPVERVA
jgi:hypothetical protein